MRKIHKIAAFALIGTITLAGQATVVQAAEDPIAGITTALDEFYQDARSPYQMAVQSLMNEISGDDNLAFAQVSNYVNIRDKAGEDGKIIGKLYNNSAASIIGEEKDWYQVISGSVTGYIKGEYLITGEEAKNIAKQLGERIAIVNTTTLKVRKEASEDSEVLTLIPLGDDYRVLEELDGWVKIEYESGAYGYVSSDYVKVQTVYEKAVSIEEEQKRLQSENSSDNGSSTKSNTASSVSSRIASYALQFEGNPYVWGGTSLTKGADCSGFTQSVFAHFGISIPRTSRTQANAGRRVSMDSLRPGDLIFYAKSGTINHVAIYIGNGKVISASSPSAGIRISNYNYRTPVRAVRYT
jgi:uncharacterized protein YgiM (DUF1202 family)